MNHRPDLEFPISNERRPVLVWPGLGPLVASDKMHLDLAPKQTIFGAAGGGGGRWVRYCLEMIFGSRPPQRKHLLSKIQV